MIQLIICYSLTVRSKICFKIDRIRIGDINTYLVAIRLILTGHPAYAK